MIRFLHIRKKSISQVDLAQHYVANTGLRLGCLGDTEILVIPQTLTQTTVSVSVSQFDIVFYSPKAKLLYVIINNQT